MSEISLIKPLNQTGKAILKFDLKIASNPDDKASISYFIDGQFNLQNLVNDISTPALEIRMIIMTLVLLSKKKTPNQLFHRFHPDGAKDSSRSKLIDLVKNKSASVEEILSVLRNEELEYLKKVELANQNNEEPKSKYFHFEHKQGVEAQNFQMAVQGGFVFSTVLPDI